MVQNWQFDFCCWWLLQFSSKKACDSLASPEETMSMVKLVLSSLNLPTEDTLRQENYKQSREEW
jgi:hypothetical protein